MRWLPEYIADPGQTRCGSLLACDDFASSMRPRESGADAGIKSAATDNDRQVQCDRAAQMSVEAPVAECCEKMPEASTV
jgi:hypothetical protein